MKPSHQNPYSSQLSVTSSRVSRLFALAFILALPWGSSAYADFLYGLTADTDAQPTATVATTGATLLPGTSGTSPGINRASVFVFQLPNLGLVSNPFSTASFTFNFASISSTPGSLDLQALDARELSTVLSADYYVGTSPLQANATVIQTTILTQTTPVGVKTTSVSGSAALVAFLNEQYNNGTGINDYVFLRFSTLTVPGASSRRYNLTSADGGVATPTDTRPRIEYTAAAIIPTTVKKDNTLALNDGFSWVGDAAPTATSIAKWDGTVTASNTTVLGADTTWSGIEIANPAGLVMIDTGNFLTLGAATTDINMSAAMQDLTLNCGLVMGAANLWDVASGRTLTLGGAVSGSFPLTTQGAGTVILSADNSYVGTTTISAGTLIVGAGGTSGSLGSGNVTGGGILAFNRSDAGSVTNTILGASAATTPKLEIRSGTITLANTADNANLGATVKSGATLILGSSSSAAIHALGGVPTVDAGGTLKLGGSGGDQIFDGADPIIYGAFDMAGLSETMGGINFGGSITNTGASAAILTIGGVNSTGNFSGTIAGGTGGLSLVKIGNAPQILSGALSYTGTTAINGGVLNLVTGTGTSTTDTTVAAAGTLKTTVTSPGQTWILGGDLTCAADSGLQFDFLSVTPSTTMASLTVDTLDTSGGSIELDLLNLGAVAIGDYPLIAFTSGTPTDGNFLAVDLPVGVLGLIKVVGNQVVLRITELHSSVGLTWTNGATTGTWNKTTGAGTGDLNWKNPAAASFYDTDSVTFNTTDFGGPITANLTVPVNTTGITVSGPSDVTITNGGGSISGIGGVTMNGSGKLDLQMDNSFTGKTVINSGTVVLSSSTNVGTNNHSLGSIPSVATDDQITINGGTLASTTSAATQFNLSAFNGVLVGESGGTITNIFGGRLSIGKLTGHTNAIITVSGAGTLAFGGDQPGYLGKWILKSGVVTVGGEGRFGTIDPAGSEPDNITLDGGHIQTTLGSPGVIFDDAGRGITLTVAGGRLSSNNSNNGTYQVVIAGTASGDLRIGDTLNGSAAQKVTFNAAHSYNGKTYIDRGILAIGAMGSIASSPEILLGNAAATTLDVSAAAFVLGSTQTLSGTGSVLGALTSNGTIAPGASTGAISFNSTLDLGSGTLKIEVDGAQTPTVDSIAVMGDLDIDSATLNLDFNGSLTAPAYVIATYGTLTGTQFASITGEAIPAGYALKYNHNGNSIALVQQGGFGPWIASFFGAETDPNIVGPNADPDKDGVQNIVEFALGGSAPNSGSASPSLFEEIVSDHLTLTVPVLNVATFAGNPLSAIVQGVTITAEGSSDLNGFVLAVEVTTANPNAPAAPTGYSNHGFRLVQTVTGNSKGFLRMSVK